MARLVSQGLLLLLLVAVSATAFAESYLDDADDAPVSYSSLRGSSEGADNDWDFDYDADEQDGFESNLYQSSYEERAPSEEGLAYDFDEDDSSEAEWNDEFDDEGAPDNDEYDEDSYDGGVQRANSDPGKRPGGNDGQLKRSSSTPAKGPEKRPKPTDAPPNSPVTRQRAGAVKGRPVPPNTAQPAKGILRQPGAPSTNQGNVNFAPHTKDNRLNPGEKFANKPKGSRFNPNNPDGTPKTPQQLQKEQEELLKGNKEEKKRLNRNPQMRPEEVRKGFGDDPVKVTKGMSKGFPIGPKAAELEGKRLESELAKDKQRPPQWQAEAQGGPRGAPSMGKKIKPKPAPKPTGPGKIEPAPLKKSKSMFGRKKGVEQDDKKKRKQDKS